MTDFGCPSGRLRPVFLFPLIAQSLEFAASAQLRNMARGQSF